MKSIIWIVSLCVIAVAGTWLGYNYGLNAQPTSADGFTKTENAQAASIRGQGKLQPASGTISIVAQPGERVDKIFVDVGAEVKADAKLVALASREIRELELQLANIQKADAIKQSELQITANRFKLKAAEIAASEAAAAKTKIENQSQAIGPLRNNLDTAQRLLDKLVSMRADPVTQDLVGQNEIDKQQALVSSIKAQVQTAEGDVDIGNQSAERAQRLANSQQELAEYTVARGSDLVPTKSLDIAIQMAQMAYDSTLLKSPIAGRVLDITVYEGDSVATRPLMLIGDTSKMICVAEITDSQIRDVRMGAAVELTSDAFEETLRGTVVEIGTMIGPPSMSDPNPYAVVDRKTGKVKIELNADDTAIAARFVNLQVEVKILLNDSGKSASNEKMETDITETSSEITVEPVLEMID